INKYSGIVNGAPLNAIITPFIIHGSSPLLQQTLCSGRFLPGRKWKTCRAGNSRLEYFNCVNYPEMPYAKEEITFAIKKLKVTLKVTQL
ncbi:MAG: hypothetical protein QUS12_14435, partial [Methanosarcina sp.]|nr:hypothetical protein [Methanosarcina sp.]